MYLIKKLAIIGANDFQNQLIQKAKSLGYETHIFAWECGDIGEKTADYFYPISIVNKDQILDKCREIGVSGVCSVASDLASITVNYVAEKLGLFGNKIEYSNIQTNKFAMRNAFLSAGIPCPKFISVSKIEFDESMVSDFKFPIIVKPTDRSGSRNIVKLETIEGLKEAVFAACETSFEKKAIIEEYLTGDEYSMETISFRGKHFYLATTKKYTTGAPNFIETGHTEPSGLDDAIIERAKKMVFSALDALHIENSAGHLEFVVDADGNIRIIEIGARMGGDCIGSDLVYLSTGNDFVKMVIDVACGVMPQVLDTHKNKKASIKFIFSNEDIIEYEKIKKESPKRIVRASKFDLENIGKIKDSSTRVGYYIIL